MDGGRQQDSPPLPFSLSFVDGRGRLTLEAVARPPLRVDRLELDIKGLTFPFDLTAGPQRLRDRWLEAERLDLSISAGELQDLIGAIDLSDRGVIDLQLDLDGGAVEIVGRLEQSDGRAWFVTRLVPDVIDGSDLLLRPALFLLLGPPVGTFPQVMAALAAAGVPGLEGAGLALRTRGLVRKVMTSLLVPAGWRLPDVRPLRLESIGLDRRSGGVLSFRRSPHDRAVTSTRAQALAEVAPLIEPGDAALSKGDLEGAREAYQRALALEPNHADIVERIAWLDAADPARRLAARLACERTLERRESAGLQGLLGSLLLDEGNREAAMEHFRAAAKDLGPLGRARTLALIGRLELEGDRARGISTLEQALTLDPSLFDALDGLREGYARLGQRDALEAVAGRLVAAAPSPSARAEVLADLGRMWRERLGDPYRAADAFEQALLADPESVEALRGLADCHADRGEHQAGLRCLDAAVRIAAARNRLGDEVAAHLRAGELWAEMGDPTSAAARFHRAARAAPRDVIALERAADADRALGRPELAAAGYGRVAALAASGSEGTDVETWRRAVERLVRVQLDDLNAPGTAMAAVERFLEAVPDDERVLALQAETARRLEALGASTGAGRAVPRPAEGEASAAPNEPMPPPSLSDLQSHVEALELPHEFPNPLAQVEAELLDELDEDPIGALDDEPEGSLEDELDALAVGLESAERLTPRSPVDAVAFASDGSAGDSVDVELFSVNPAEAPTAPELLDPDEGLDEMIQRHLRSPGDEALANQVIEELEAAEDWTRLAAVLAGQIERLAGLDDQKERHLELLNHLAEVLIAGLDDPQSGAECLLRIAAASPGAAGVDHARRAAALLRQIGQDEDAREADDLAERLLRSGEEPEG